MYEDYKAAGSIGFEGKKYTLCLCTCFVTCSLSAKDKNCALSGDGAKVHQIHIPSKIVGTPSCKQVIDPNQSLMDHCMAIFANK